MADQRFFQVAGPFSIDELATIAKAEISTGADREKRYGDVAPLQDAGASELSFLDNPNYLEAFEASQAGLCIVHPRYAERAPKGMDLLLSETPYSAYARIANAFYPPRKRAATVHQTAVIDPTAEIGEDVDLGPYVIVSARAKIGASCRIAGHVVIGEGVVVGEGTTIGPGASLSHCLVGSRCQLHAGVRIGNRGFGFTLDPDGFLDVPQLGRVVLGDNVEVGANSTIDRGAGPDTTVGSGSKIDNLVQIGHNVQIGQHCVLVAQSGVAGSTRLENQVVLAAQAGLAGHLTIGQGAQIAAQSGVMRDVPAGQKMFGSPAMPIRDFFRLFSTWQRQLKSQGKKG